MSPPLSPRSRVRCYCEGGCPPTVQSIIAGIRQSAASTLQCDDASQPGRCILDMEGLPVSLAVRSNSEICGILVFLCVLPVGALHARYEGAAG